MPRVWLPYDPKAGPSVSLLWRAQLPGGGWGKTVSFSAIIDSGATVSSIKHADLTDMGLDAKASFEEMTTVVMSDAWGNTHPAEFASTSIVAKLAPPGFPGGWGPVMRWEASGNRLSVADGGARLLGTSDFFEQFEVSFMHSANGSRLSVAY